MLYVDFSIHMMDISKQSHHERLQLCTTRSTYRQGKKLTAVKVNIQCNLRIIINQ